MHRKITREQHHKDYHLVRQYEFQQLPPGKSLRRLLYAVGTPILLRHEIERLLGYCIDKDIILFPSVRDISDVYFTAYFDPEHLLTAHSWWGHSFGKKAVDILARAFKKSNCTFGSPVDTPLPVPDLVDDHRQRENESHLSVLPADDQAVGSLQGMTGPGRFKLSATGSVISPVQCRKAVVRYHAYEEQQRGAGRPLLALLKQSGAHTRIYNGVLQILRDHIKAQLIPFTYSGDVTDEFFTFYFTGEDMLRIRSFGFGALQELEHIMAENGLLFR